MAESVRPDRELLSEESGAPSVQTLKGPLVGGLVIKEQWEESPPHLG